MLLNAAQLAARQKRLRLIPAEEADMAAARAKCLTQLAPNAAKLAKSHSNRLGQNRFTAWIVSVLKEAKPRNF
jgi:hypothetical protein